MPHITAINPSKRGLSKLIVQVDGQSVGTLPAKQVEALGLEVGGAWTSELAAKAKEIVADERAFEQAMRIVNRKAMSRAALAQKLGAAGHGADVIERIMQRLTAIGAVSDEALARDLLEEIDRTRPAGPAMKRAKLAQRGVDEETIERVMEGASTGQDQREAARRLVASKERSMARLDEATRRRRLWGLLARRGFDEDVIESVLGAVDE